MFFCFDSPLTWESDGPFRRHLYHKSRKTGNNKTEEIVRCSVSPYFNLAYDESLVSSKNLNKLQEWKIKKEMDRFSVAYNNSSCRTLKFAHHQLEPGLALWCQVKSPVHSIPPAQPPLNKAIHLMLRNPKGRLMSVEASLAPFYPILA